MKKLQKGAFTLVELIVVITILAILGTIGFISFQGYSQDARNTARTSDVGNLTRALNLKATEGLSVRSMTAGGQEVANAELGGAPANQGGDNYSAGDIDPLALGVPVDDFVDPITGDLYKMGAYTGVGGQYFQVGATLESAGSTALVRGNYVPRTNDAITGTATNGSDSFQISSPTDLGKFREGDYVTSANLPADTQISKIEGTTVFLSNEFTGDDTSLALGSNEVLGLISAVAVDGAGAGAPVVDGGNSIAMDIGSGAGSNSSTSGGGTTAGGGTGGGTTGGTTTSTTLPPCTFAADPNLAPASQPDESRIGMCSFASS